MAVVSPARLYDGVFLRKVVKRLARDTQDFHRLLGRHIPARGLRSAIPAIVKFGLLRQDVV